MLASNVPDTEKCDGILELHTDNVRLLVVTEIPLFSTEISPIAVRNSLILFIALAYCCGSFPICKQKLIGKATRTITVKPTTIPSSHHRLINTHSRTYTVP